LATIAEQRDTTPKDFDGWTKFYRLLRDDGSEVAADVQCSGTAAATASQNHNEEALAVMDNQASMLVVKLAETAQPSARRGAVLIRVWFDEIDGGNVRHDFVYGDP
jgi:hypothetical protein